MVENIIRDSGFLGFLSIYPKTIPMYVVCELVAFAIAFALTIVWGKGHLKEEVETVEAPVSAEEETAAEVAPTPAENKGE